MGKTIKIKDAESEQRLFNRRAFILTLIIFCAFAALVGRLIFLQIIEHHRYTTLSIENQLNLIPIEPARGLIYDRNGVLVAENLPVFSLDIIPEKVKHLKETIAELNKLIPIDPDDLKDFYKTLPQKRQFEPVPLKLNLTESEAAKFYINQWRFPGVLINARMLRYYPLGPTMAHVVGYMGRINEEELKLLDPDNYSASNYIGKLGIEKYYESQLHGQVGYQQVETDADGRIVRVLKRTPPVAGKSIYLTIDSKLELAAEQALGDDPGAVLAIDPRNGEVLAFVSNPSYNPNLFVEGISTQAFKALQDAPNKPLYDRAIRGVFAPGSTVKPFIAAGALGLGLITPTFSIRDPGFFVLGTHTYKDWKKGGHGVVSVQKAVTVSCDTFFYTVAQKIGINNLDKIYFSFGLGNKTGIDIPDELSGLVPTPAWKLKVKKAAWYGGDTIVAGIGQGYVLVTPLQMANAVATMANRGVHFTPHLLLKFLNPNGTITPYLEKPNHIVNYPASAFDTAIAGMEGVINSPQGTGYKFGKDVPYPVAAKTGTAQVYSFSLRKVSDKNQAALPFNLRDNSWFIAFAPVDNPKIAVAVIAEHSGNAAHIARQVMDYYLLTEKNLPEDLLSQVPADKFPGYVPPTPASTSDKKPAAGTTQTPAPATTPSGTNTQPASIKQPAANSPVNTNPNPSDNAHETD